MVCGWHTAGSPADHATGIPSLFRGSPDNGQGGYGRTVARLYVEDLDVSREMVRLGAAWVYRKYNKDKSLLDVEAEAREAKRGLWSLPEAEQVPPWEWRRRK